MARLFGIHKNTVRNWLRQGLEPIDEQRPILIRGHELRRFLITRRTRTKQICGPGRIYCLPCREPKVPAGNMAECIATSETSGTLQGICPDCNRMIYRRINPQKLDTVRGELDVTITRAPPRILETVAEPFDATVVIEQTRGNHLRSTFIIGTRQAFIITSLTPSDWRTSRQVEADARRTLRSLAGVP